MRIGSHHRQGSGFSLDRQPIPLEPSRELSGRSASDLRQFGKLAPAEIGKHGEQRVGYIGRRRTVACLDLRDDSSLKPQLARELILALEASGDPDAAKLLAEPYPEITPGITIVRWRDNTVPGGTIQRAGCSV
jgi:hypothetical protein